MDIFLYCREHRKTPKDYLSQRAQRAQRVVIHSLGERCGRGEKDKEKGKRIKDNE